MKIRMLTGAACAGLMAFAVSAIAADGPQASAFGATALFSPDSAARAVSAYYAARPGTLIWLKSGANSVAATQLLQILRRAPLDGLASGPDLAGQAQSLLSAARAGDDGARDQADRLLSIAWVRYVQAIQTPPAGMIYADNWVAPRRSTPAQILGTAAIAPSLSQHIARVSQVNPIYAQLRDAAWNEMQVDGSTPDRRVLISLDRARDMPFQHRYIMVDTASATLWMIEDGHIADSMKVIVGKPSAQTPMLASTIYYATLNPYWNVPDDLLRNLIGPRIVAQGIKYITDHRYDVLSGYGPNPEKLDPAKIDWKKVVAGDVQVRLRQRPGPANSMGEVKFGFANPKDIYLHDSPEKDLFAEDSRNLSNGCIRLSDAPRLARWLLGRNPEALGADAPEQNIILPTPVPIYVTYLTAQVQDGRLAFVDDVYDRDLGGGVNSAVAALR